MRGEQRNLLFSRAMGLLAEGKIVIFDLEYTTWEGAMARNWSGEGEYCEIVQIGAVKLDRRNDFCEIATFNRLVRPRVNPQLSDYFVNLTGVTQVEVDENGRPFPEVISDFHAFVGDDTSMVYSFGGDEKFVYLNCGLHKISCPIGPRQFRDIMPIFQIALDKGLEPLTTGQLPELVDFTPPGRAHDALADVRCTAAALRIIKADRA